MPESLPKPISPGREPEQGGVAGSLLLGSEHPWPQPSPGPTSARSAVTLGGMLRQKWLMLGIFVLVSGLAVPPVWLLIKPLYESRAVIEVSPIVSRLVYQTDQNGVVPFYESFLNTQVSRIRSSRVLQRVLDQPDIKASHWYTVEGEALLGRPLQPYERLLQCLSVQPRPRTNLIDVSVGTQRPAEAQLIVNEVVKQFLDDVKSTGQDEATKLVETLKTEKKAREDRIKYLRTQSVSVERPGLLSSEQVLSTLSSQLSLLESRRAEVQREAGLMRWKKDRITPTASTTTTAPASAPAADVDEFNRFAADSEWHRLNAEKEKAQLALTVARLNLGDGSSRVKELLLVADHADRLLREREDDLRKHPGLAAASQPAAPYLPTTVADIVDPHILADRIAAREEEVRLLDEDIKAKQAELRSVQQSGVNEDALKHEEEVYEDVTKRLNALEMESKSNAPTRIERVADGLAPSMPSKDRRVLMTLMALCGAAGCAAGVGYLRALGDSRIREPQQVMHVTHVPFLGQLPEVPAKDLPSALGGASLNGRPAPGLLESLAGCSSALMEGVRMVRTALLDRLSASPSQVVLITSPVSQSGKSSFVVMLASSFTLLGKKVLVVETDMYRPSLAKRLGMKPGPGLAQLLHGEVRDTAAIARGNGVPFDLLPAGDIRSETDPELLANGVFSSCLSRWSAKYDLILLDGPPVLAVADSRIIARHCAGTVMVMRASHDRHGEATEAYAALTDLGRNVLGTVLVGGQSRTGRGYAGDYYGYRRLGPAAHPAGEALPPSAQNSDGVAAGSAAEHRPTAGGSE